MAYVDIYGEEVKQGDWCIVCYNNYTECMIYKSGTHFYRPSRWALREIKEKNKMPKVEFLNSGFSRRVIKITDEKARQFVSDRWKDNFTSDDPDPESLECMNVFEQRLR